MSSSIARLHIPQRLTTLRTNCRHHTTVPISLSSLSLPSRAHISPYTHAHPYLHSLRYRGRLVLRPRFRGHRGTPPTPFFLPDPVHTLLQVSAALFGFLELRSKLLLAVVNFLVFPPAVMRFRLFLQTGGLMSDRGHVLMEKELRYVRYGRVI